MKLYNSVLSFGTTVYHRQEDGADLTQEYVLKCVIDRINNVFDCQEELEAFELLDTQEETVTPQGDCQSIYSEFQTAMVKAGFDEEISYLDEQFREFLEWNEIEVRV